VTQLVELQRLLVDRPGVEAQVLAVSADNHEQSRQLLKDLDGRTPVTAHTALPLLEDQAHRVIDRYGIFNPQSRGWPHPATYVIDKTGTVRWRFVETDYRVRPTNDDIVGALKSLD
jgi:peroxiredoxin